MKHSFRIEVDVMAENPIQVVDLIEALVAAVERKPDVLLQRVYYVEEGPRDVKT